MPLVTLIPYRPSFTLPLSLSLSFCPSQLPRKKFSQSPFPLSGYFAVSRGSVATSPWAPSSPPPPPVRSLFLAVYSSSGLVFLGTKTRQTHRGVDVGPNISLPSKEFRSSEYIYQEREWRERKERRERARPLPPSLPPSPRAMLTYSLYPTIRGRVAPPPRSLAPRSLAFILASDDDVGGAKPHSHSRREE